MTGYRLIGGSLCCKNAINTPQNSSLCQPIVRKFFTMNAPTLPFVVTADPLFRFNDPADTDPQETAEWADAFAALLASQGPARARFMLDALARQARSARAGNPSCAPRM